jgi:hypothetical protein
MGVLAAEVENDDAAAQSESLLWGEDVPSTDGEDVPPQAARSADN